LAGLAKPSSVVNGADRTAPPARVGSSSYFIDLSIFERSARRRENQPLGLYSSRGFVNPTGARPPGFD
jgi:hypothetical protein